MTETQTPATVPALVLRRTYSAPRQRVFDAWTTPETIKKFFGPRDMTVPEAELDVRTGGSFRIVMQDSDGDQYRARGTYCEVRAPERLSMTWRWEEDDPADEFDTVLSLDFNEIAGGTELVLTHEQLRSLESRDRHEGGW